MCTPDIEYLTVSITNTAEPYTVAVIYRPPSGNLQLFNQELLNFMSQLPDKNVFIMGDFNINLHNITQSNCQEYEEIVISSGYFPLISISTHAQPNCVKTCIDNIICNSPDIILASGTLTDRISHHSPIFQVSTINTSQSQNNTQKITIYYDYSRENIENFCASLKVRFDNPIDTFDEFVDSFQISVFLNAFT